MRFYIYIVFVVVALVGCQNTIQIDEVVNELPDIYPDYVDVTIPVNIAPLNFRVKEGAERVRVCVEGKKQSVVVEGKKEIRFHLNTWKKLLQSSDTLQVTVQMKKQNRWVEYRLFYWYVVADAIDPYLSYRLIEPGYEVWNKLQIVERCVESFEERAIADNHLVENSCMNCHIYNHQNPKQSMFHIRGKHGGTILNNNGQLRKVNARTDNMISNAVYGGFHPGGKYAVFSTNIIIPEFHAYGSEKLEVYDTNSDLIILDLSKNETFNSPIIADSSCFETFPVFSASGDRIFYCGAEKVKLPEEIKQLKYSICSVGFNSESREVGSTVDTLWNAHLNNQSVCHLKPSPDGKYLLYTVSEYGTFPIWHREADLQMLHLENGRVDSLNIVNADYSDSYHSWSSNSRWFVFASKRDNGIYGKPYFCYIDENGVAHKPFVLPQKSPSYYDITLKSFNIPELSAYPVSFDALDIEDIYWNSEAELFTAQN